MLFQRKSKMTTPQYNNLECRTKLQDLYEGRTLVIPADLDHAYQMLNLSLMYIRDDQQRVMSYLKQDIVND
jgi:hypothetical protein